MPDVNRGNRPLSPFMIGPYYRPQMTSMLSIAHRITGVGLAVGLLMGVAWFLAAASGPEAFATVDGLVRSWIGGLILILSTFALWYHTLNGIRHLIWDAGWALDIERAEKLGYAVIGGTVLLSVITLIVAF